MTIEEAHRIAAARLGPALHNVTRGGPTADEWLVQVVPPSGPLLSARAAGLEEAIGEAEAQLRAAGWVPSHPRLEWAHHATSGTHTLDMLMDGAVLNVAVIVSIEQVLTQRYHYYVGIQTRRIAVAPRRDTRFDSLEDAVAHISEWCATNLPSLPLPPFPETPDAY